MPVDEVNSKKSIKNSHFYHCFKLTDSEYALFDIKMDMPLIIGSIALIKGARILPNSTVFYYVVNGSKGYFEKTPQKTIEVNGALVNKKPPLRFKKINPFAVIYHHFKLSPVLSVLFDGTFEMPVIYGDNQKVSAAITKLDKSVSILYYKEDGAVKNSFKMWMVYKGKKPK